MPDSTAARGRIARCSAATVYFMDCTVPGLLGRTGWVWECRRRRGRRGGFYGGCRVGASRTSASATRLLAALACSAACCSSSSRSSALVYGLALARSITGSVHELFVGTERVRQGDFTHQITIESRDQLGELAESFNA